MQPDRRLVEDVHDARQSRAHLAREPDALRFAAGQRFGAAIEREVVEAHVDEELQAVADFLDDLVGHFRAPAGDVERAEHLLRIAHGQVRDLRQAVRADEHIARRAIQTRAVAVGAGLRAEILRELLAHGQRVGFLVAAFEVRNDALEAMLLLRRAAVAVRVAEFHFVVAAAEQHHLLRLLRQIFPGRFRVELVVLRHRGDQREVVRVLAIPALDGAAREREMGIGDDAQRDRRNP